MSLFKKITSILLNKLGSILENHNRVSTNTGSFFHPSIKMRGARINGLVEIGEGCKLIDVRMNTGSKITIGRYTSLSGPNTDIISYIYPVNIGSFCSIARNVSIQEFNHCYNGLTTYHIHKNIFNENRLNDIYSNGAVEIGNDVWIGTQCVITGGAKIGNGSVIAANSVVIGEIPPFAIVGGSPAKIIKYRFDKETIQFLQKLKWWDWPIEKIKLNKDLFNNDFSVELLQKLEKYNEKYDLNNNTYL